MDRYYEEQDWYDCAFLNSETDIHHIFGQLNGTFHSNEILEALVGEGVEYVEED